MATRLDQFNLAESWARYARAVVPAEAGPNQRQQLRDAFYGGAGLTVLVMMAIGEPDVTEAEGLAVLSSLKDDVSRYVKARARGGTGDKS